MLIGRDDISNDVITLGTCFHVFYNVCYIHAGFHLVLIGGNLTAQLTGSHRGIGGGILIPETQLQVLLIIVSFLFPPHCQSVPISKCHAQLTKDSFSSPVGNVYSWFLSEETQGTVYVPGGITLEAGKRINNKLNHVQLRCQCCNSNKEELGGKSSQQSAMPAPVYPQNEK